MQREHHAEYYEDEEMGESTYNGECYNVTEDNTARNVISRDIRSQSEYQMRKPTPGPALNQRAASYNDDSDLFSEITVCMSQVRVSRSSSLYNSLCSGLVLVEVLDSKLEEVAELVSNSNEQIQEAKMEGQEADDKDAGVTHPEERFENTNFVLVSLGTNQDRHINGRGQWESDAWKIFCGKAQ